MKLLSRQAKEYQRMNDRLLTLVTYLSAVLLSFLSKERWTRNSVFFSVNYFNRGSEHAASRKHDCLSGCNLSSLIFSNSYPGVASLPIISTSDEEAGDPPPADCKR